MCCVNYLAGVVKPSFVLFMFLVTTSVFAQSDSIGNQKHTSNEAPKHRPIDLIPYECGNLLRYIVIDSSTKYVVVAVADNNRNIISDTLFQQQSTYSDETLSAFLQSILIRNVDLNCFLENRKLLVRKIRDRADEIFQLKASENDKATIENLVNELQKEFIAGSFNSPSKEIPLYGTAWTDTVRGQTLQKHVADSLEKVEISDAFARRNKSKNYFLIADSITIRTDYNRIKDLKIYGRLHFKQDSKDTSMAVTIKNDAYSLGLDGLNHNKYIRKIPELSANSLWLNYADVVQYGNFMNESGNIIANQSLLLVPGGRALARKRNLNEYLSFRTFLDPLGFLGSNPNGFAQLEGDAIVPTGLVNRGKWNSFPQLSVNFSYIYSNSINNEPRIVPVYSLRNTARPDITNPLVLTSTDTSRFVSNLDYVRYSYYHLKAHLSLVALELKNWSSWLHFELGIKVLGSKVDTVATATRVVHKLIPEARLRLEIRPDYIVGASLSAGLAYLGNTHQGNNPPQNIKDVSFLYRSPFAIPHELNVYAITSSGKGGLFFRYGGWLAFHRRLAAGVSVANLSSNVGIMKSSYFPQILIGYATNLSAIVNRVPKQTAY